MTSEVPSKPTPPTPQWDEPRIVVFLIGLCLIIESGLIYYQAGPNMAVVSGITGVSGLTLLLFSWLVPLEDEDHGAEDGEADSATSPEALPKTTEPLPPPTKFPSEPGKTLFEDSQKTPIRLPTTELVAEKPIREVPPVVPPLEKVAEKTVAEKTVAEKPVAEKPEEDDSQLSWYDRLRRGLSKTRTSFVGKLKKLVFGTTRIDSDLLEELEEALFEADVGPKTYQELMSLLHHRVEKEEIKDPAVIFQALREELRKRLMKYPATVNMNSSGLTVFLIIGVNGVGKTTTIAKLANRYKNEGKTVILAAGDTFRAAAIDQLGIWGDRAGVEVIKGQEGGDPGALVFDAIHAARKRNAHLLIIDTAGRMHVKTNLMDELKKIRKIVEKEAGGPHETFLVLDANTGQNAVQQAKQFNEGVPITGLIMTKLDGTAKGGVLFAVEEQLNVPVKFIGVGEKMKDLLDFQPEQFLEALFADDEKSKESDYKVL